MILFVLLLSLTVPLLCRGEATRERHAPDPVLRSNVTNKDTGLPILLPIRYVDTASQLRIAYYDDGPVNGQAVILVHGFPYDINSFADVAPDLVKKGYRVLAPYLRGYGNTTFLNDSTPRSAEQAAFGYDLLTFMDALGIKHAILAGFDWGTIPVNVVAALWPSRCNGMVTVGSYLIQNPSTASIPSDPYSEASRWYFYLFLIPRGYAALVHQLPAYARAIWAKNSPQWHFSDAEFERTLPALYNPDFINITVDFYRSRLLPSPGDPQYAQLANALNKQPPVSVPSVTLDPGNSTTFPATDGSASAIFFTGPRVHRVIKNTGENIPQQNPEAFVEAILEVDSLSKRKSEP